MFCGFAAILVSIRGEYRLAAVLIGLSIVFDITDGAVARLVGAVTPFGLQFDSLADLVSFGLAPALLAFTLFSQGRDQWDPLGWIACFLWLACAAIRLARFNTTIDPTADKRYFTGMPSPGAAGVVLASVFAFGDADAGPRPAVGAAGRRRPGAAHGQQRPVPLVPVAGQPEERPAVRADRPRRCVLVVGLRARIPTITGLALAYGYLLAPLLLPDRLPAGRLLPARLKEAARHDASRPDPARRRPRAWSGLVRELADYEKAAARGAADRGAAARAPSSATPPPSSGTWPWRRGRRGRRHGPVVPELLHLARHARHLPRGPLRPARSTAAAGLGRELLRTLAAVCVERGYSRLEWSVLDWNTPSIEFYKAAGAVPMDELDRLPAHRRRAGRVRPTAERPMTTERAPAECWLTDMDGVLVHEEQRAARRGGVPASGWSSGSAGSWCSPTTRSSPRATCAPGWPAPGCDVPEESIWTSALATADFLADQLPGGSAYVIGEAGLTTALHEVGYTLTDTDPDYVVLGETRTYSFEAITRAIRLIGGGARFIATNPDVTGPSPEGPLPATGSVAALITKATGARALLRRQAQPDDVPQRAEPDRGALGDHRHDRRPDGHRRRRRHRGRPGDDPGAHRLDAGRRRRPLPVPAEPGAATRSPTSSTWSERPSAPRRPAATRAWPAGRARRPRAPAPGCRSRAARPSNAVVYASAASSSWRTTTGPRAQPATRQQTAARPRRAPRPPQRRTRPRPSPPRRCRRCW